MDDIWQRHKTFIVQCLVGGIVFLLALLVKSNMYDTIENRQSNAHQLKGMLEKEPGPSRDSIRKQVAKADEAREQTSAMAAKVASLESGLGYVRENIAWVCANLGMPERADEFFTMYSDLPQACLSRLREEARAVLVSKAAALGKEVPEQQGITNNFEDSDVKYAIHGLAIATDIVGRCLALEGIDSVESITVSPRPRRRVGEIRQDGARARAFSISFKLLGKPGAVNALLRSFNTTDNAVQRLTVLDRVEYIQRLDKEEDTVRASFDLFGIQYRGIEE